MRTYLQKTTIISSYKQPPDLRGILTSSRFDERQTTNIPKVAKYEDKRCSLCEEMIEGLAIRISSEKTFYIRQDMNCKSQHVVYMMTCWGCNERYIDHSKLLLEKRSKMRTYLQKTTIISSYKQPPDLRGILTSSRFDERQTTNTPKVAKCEDKRCSLCEKMIEGLEIRISSEKTFYIRQDMNCKSQHVVYMMTCWGCNERYIDNSKLLLEKRSKMRTYLQKTTIISSYKKPPDLRGILTSSRFDERQTTNTPKVAKCEDKGCSLCEDMIEGLEIRISSEKTFYIRQNMNCK
ncbi:hypothetical protein SNE40_013079 [Patella caerulea]|uniref:Uncharacterized protein n=1 Tax=Patella caerulea TaxID=87958 RepID=A0AAN8PWI3_PATCE